MWSLHGYLRANNPAMPQDAPLHMVDLKGQYAHIQDDIDKAMRARDKALDSEKGRRTLALAGKANAGTRPGDPNAE